MQDQTKLPAQQKIALVNDITGFGRCSTAVMAPIVSAMTIQAVAVPTAILSAHTQFPHYYYEDFTPKMREYIQSYKDLKLEFDGIATGFLGSEEQVDIVADFIESFKKENTMVLVDPVMGDDGILYRTYTKGMCERMRELVKYAHILTPNLTELCVLLDTDYGNGKFSLDELHDMCAELANQGDQPGSADPAQSSSTPGSAEPSPRGLQPSSVEPAPSGSTPGILARRGPKHIVVTGIPFNDYQIMNYIYTKDEDPRIVMVDKIGENRGGTGDVISAVIAGKYLTGHSFYDSVKIAADFTSKCLKYCEETGVPNTWGLSFEMFLKDLIN